MNNLEEEILKNLTSAQFLFKIDSKTESQRNSFTSNENQILKRIGSDSKKINSPKSCKVSLICHFFPCMKNFKSRENLDLHILNIHLKIKPFNCEYCVKKFSHRNGIFLY